MGIVLMQTVLNDNIVLVIGSQECVADLIGLYKKNGAVSCVGFDFVSF